MPKSPNPAGRRIANPCPKGLGGSNPPFGVYSKVQIPLLATYKYYSNRNSISDKIANKTQEVSKTSLKRMLRKWQELPKGKPSDFFVNFGKTIWDSADNIRKIVTSPFRYRPEDHSDEFFDSIRLTKFGVAGCFSGATLFTGTFLGAAYLTYKNIDQLGVLLRNR
jgi:hypothetical protein